MRQGSISEQNPLWPLYTISTASERIRRSRAEIYLHDPAKEALLIKHKEESFMEEMRILYVAATGRKQVFCRCWDIDGAIEKCRLLSFYIWRVPQSFLAHGKAF